MTQNSKTIIWKKWMDPFDFCNSEEDEEDEEEELYHDSYEETERKQEYKPGSHPGTLLVGPMGVIPLNEHNQPSKVFNFWMGHTNFDIREQEKDIIETTPGIETLEIYTRYRIRISIGQAFDENEVMDDIEKRLLEAEKTVGTKPAPIGLNKVKQHLGSKYKFWAIFVLPDGQLDYRTGETKDSVKEKIASYPMKADVLTSWEVNNAEQVTKKTSNGRGV